MKIALLSSAHKHDDDRLFHHFAKTLAQKGHLITIISSECDFKTEGEISISSFNGLNFNRKQKIKIYIDKLSQFNPDAIICLEPLPILAAKKYAKGKNTKIIYDITEWYPSKNQLEKYHYLLRLFYAIPYFIAFLYSCSLADGFIYGEYYKGLIPKKIFSKKKNIHISYYPKKEYIIETEPNITHNLLRLSYSGTISKEKGFIYFLNVLKELIKNNENLTIQVKIIGRFNPKEKKEYFNLIGQFNEKVSFSVYDFQELSKFIELINDTDIFLDLRTLDFINSHCLPIKLFYFIALKRPIIYSDLKAIKKEIATENFGHLVNPKNYKNIAHLIQNYQENEKLYLTHCVNARNSFETKYNWTTIETKFTDFIESFKS